MRLSVIVPVYNVEKYIRECLESLFIQDVSAEEVEFLIVNDGTKDNSQVIVDEYVVKDGRFKSFIKVNGGLSDARNYGIERASGDYVMCLDSDDLLAEGSIRKVLDSLDSDLDCLVFDMKFFWEDSDETKIIKGMDGRNSDPLKSLLLSTPSICNKVVRRELLLAHPFPVGLYYEDLGTTPMLVSDCRNVKYLNEPFYLYRQREGSIIYTYSAKTRDIFTDLKRVLDYYKESGSFEKYYDELEYLVVEHLLLHGNRRFYHADDPKPLFKESRTFADAYFKNCLKNKYYAGMSANDRLFVYLAYHGQYGLLKLIIDLKGKLR